MSRFEDRLNLLAPAPASDALRARLALPAARRRIWTRTVPMAAAAAGLIAAISLTLLKAPPGTPTAPPEAEKEFRRMEEALVGLKSLRVSIRRVAALQDPKGIERVETTGRLLLKQGNRMHLTVTETRAAETPKAVTTTFDYFCDGKEGVARVKSPQGMKTVQTIAVRPTDLREKFAVALSRESVVVPASILLTDLGDLKGRLEVSRFTWGSEEGGVRIVYYKVGEFDAALWIDPLRLVPVKRILTHREIGTIKEFYEDWELDPELPDEMFRPN